ncbi:adenylate/guanylate cyclase domain-containing protein [Macrococcoides bohemicum]|uniref:adenylate/guanylate cyclase domain-containing protein n=1 Tax=Macrococcoides bohemicum TaxID=1903056 RepID=UPI00165DA3D1|nr:adenylate/guanylate cyclase domain-containing protein [Macrococcus bohemicus]MBC9873470.1 adenylate/guanylate cyclase domain-containing protein [Macrococcus bohemicus]
MGIYEFEKIKDRVEDILDKTDDIKDTGYIPIDENFTYSNGYKGWITSIFIDLRNSTELFRNNSELETAKIIRGFTSEVIQYLNSCKDAKLREIGIRGDCVYAIYNTRYQGEIHEVYDKSIEINTYIYLLNKLLTKRGMQNIKVGIGIASSEILAIKAGRYGSGIHDLVWIGDSVAIASNLSDIGNKGLINSIVLSTLTYNNIRDHLKDDKKEKFESFFTYDYHKNCYHGGVIKTEFKKWIDNL